MSFISQVRKLRARAWGVEVGLGLFLAVPSVLGFRVCKEVPEAPLGLGQLQPLSGTGPLSPTPSPVDPPPGSGWEASWPAAWLPGYQPSGQPLPCPWFLPVPGLGPLLQALPLAATAGLRSARYERGAQLPGVRVLTAVSHGRKLRLKCSLQCCAQGHITGAGAELGFKSSH